MYSIYSHEDNYKFTECCTFIKFLQLFVTLSRRSHPECLAVLPFCATELLPSYPPPYANGPWHTSNMVFFTFQHWQHKNLVCSVSQNRADNENRARLYFSALPSSTFSPINLNMFFFRNKFFHCYPFSF